MIGKPLGPRVRHPRDRAGSAIQNTKLQKYIRGTRRLSDPRAMRAIGPHRAYMAFTI